jgi:methylated-DNA-[protein]-cysteine S-methyltransferase
MSPKEDIEMALRRGGTEQSGELAARAARRVAERAAEDGLADILFSSIDSPFGPLLAASTRSGLLKLAFPEQTPDAVLEEIAGRVSPRIVEAPLDPLRRELEEYFSGRRTDFDLDLDWSLTSGFSRRVLDATAAIPYGGVSSYAAVAAEAGSPRAHRAAGNALGANPIPIVVPCHRVLRSGGVLGGYGGGPERKRWLLELEGAL